MIEMYAKETLQQRISSPEEIARMILFLVSDACPSMIGQNSVVDAGMVDNVPNPDPNEDGPVENK